MFCFHCMATFSYYTKQNPSLCKKDVWLIDDESYVIQGQSLGKAKNSWQRGKKEGRHNLEHYDRSILLLFLCSDQDSGYKNTILKDMYRGTCL